MTDEFAIAYSCWSVEDAHLARIHLAEEGIEAHLANDKAIGMYWALANAMLGVKVLVKSAEVTRGRELLDSKPARDIETDGSAFASALLDEATSVGGEHSLDTEEWHNDDNDNNLTEGILGVFRSIKKPVIWMLLTPTILSIFSVLALLSAMFFGELQKFGWI